MMKIKIHKLTIACCKQACETLASYIKGGTQTENTVKRIFRPKDNEDWKWGKLHNE